MKSICLALLFLIPMASWAADISVGGVSIEIPNPTEFSPITEQMVLMYEIQQQFVPPTNVEFVAFIPEQDVPAVLKGNIPELPRRFVVQTAQSLVGISVSNSDFAKLKSVIKSQNDEIMKKAEALLPGLMDKINEDIQTKYDVDLSFSVPQVLPMPVHQENDRTLAYSSLVKYDMKDEHGNPAPFIAVVTATFVHVKGKVIFLYAYAEESGLEWSKEASRQWAGAVVAMNPSDLNAAAKEALPSFVSGIDWGKVGAKAIAGAITGLIIGLIAWRVKRGKAS